ncbi:MAG: glycosyltransferase family 1 protein [Candidatus Electrothrix sp. AR1]|nr:glycosyltransferase family 1 protein [Candidatus Electrothrix sp. AR1]
MLTSYLDIDLSFQEITPEGYSVQRFGKFAWVEESFKKKFRYIRHMLSWSAVDRINDAVEFWTMLPFSWFSRLSFMLDLRKFFRKNFQQIDVVHVHEAHWIAGAVGWACKGLGLPVVCKEADCPAMNKISYDAPLRSALARHRHQVDFIAMTEAIAESLQDSGIAENRIARIPNGVELPAGMGEIAEQRDVVYVGNFTQGNQRKAFDILFEAWVSVQKQDKGRVRLVMLGTGNSDIWKKYLEQHQCLDTVYFAGAVQNVSLYLQNARLFLLPSRIEGLSNALLEAMSWGLPVIVSDIPANLSLVRHRINGWAVPVNDSRALADAVLTLLADEALSQQLGRSARQEIEEHYTMDHIATRLTELYRVLMAKSRSNVPIRK